MEARRVSANPRPSCVRRVIARKRPRPEATANSAWKLQRREISALPGRTFAVSTTRERFRNIQHQEEFDTHDPKENGSLLPYLRKRSEIIEIFGARDIIFTLSQSGVCAAFSTVTNQRICFLNGSPDGVIRSLFYNKNNDSLITVSVYGSENFSALRCRTTRIEYIWRAKPDAGFPLFETESLKWPGFVEFDDVNGMVLTYSAQDRNSGRAGLLSGRKCSPKPGPDWVGLGSGCRAGPPVNTSTVEWVPLVRNFKSTEVSRSEFVTTLAFIFLYEMQLFLTFRSRSVSVWNFHGELVTSFEDHLLWHPDCNTNRIYITSNQDLIISYCKADPNDSSSEDNACSINISEILTGKCLAKIKAGNLCKQKKPSKFQTTPSEPWGTSQLCTMKKSAMRSTPATDKALYMCGQINSCSGLCRFLHLAPSNPC